MSQIINFHEKVTVCDACRAFYGPKSTCSTPGHRFLVQNAPKRVEKGPKRVQEGPNMAQQGPQETPKVSQEGPKGSPRGPWGAQKPSKRLPKHPKMLPNETPGPPPEQFSKKTSQSDNFGAILEPIWEPILLTLGTFFDKN